METIPTVAPSLKIPDPDTIELVANPKASTFITITPLLLERVPCIYYLLCFRKDKSNIENLIDSSSEVNTITLAYAKKLGLQTQKMDVSAQKIDGSSLATYEIVIARF